MARIPTMTAIEKWVNKSEIDYMTYFIKTWIPFNAWYNRNYPNGNDRAKIQEIKKDSGGVPYNPDFIIETANEMIIAEVKNHNEMNDDVVIAKASAANQWISFVNEIAKEKGKKEWRYLLIPDNAISPSTTLNGLISAHTWQDN